MKVYAAIKDGELRHIHTTAEGAIARFTEDYFSHAYDDGEPLFEWVQDEYGDWYCGDRGCAPFFEVTEYEVSI